MKFRLALVLAAGVAVAACSSQSDHLAGSAKGVAKVSPSAAAVGAVTRDAATRGRFANLPDRGMLVRYPDQAVVRRDGAYTWHRADLSESHALSAIGGVLAITTPSGQLLRFRYERHVEHPNGDWTWVGSLGNGSLQEAVITFGAKAAFGSIGQPGEEALRLTMRNGASWLVETDLAEIARLDNVGTRPTEPDFLIAPEVASSVRPRASAPAATTVGAPRAAGVGAVAATAAAATTVDLVLGYTNGFASAWGGDSQAQTRLNNMVEITNETYANSQIDARVRLVRAVAVNYPDATANEDALEELTGYRDGVNITPNAAFNALRAARDQYGGDLVSLVRKFNSPENDGCGIAWLIGGGRRGSISASSERFGYSVVSDGEDAGTDGKTYFCRQETLAHELGHNMGAAHDRDTSDGDDNVLQDSEYGIYDYSFGYKTTAGAGNFYTVMAYGDSGQVRNRIFSNPRISKCGAESNTNPRGLGPSTPTGTLPCGTAAADNARTLSQTMPVIATFRSTVVPSVPVYTDINADGRSDLPWVNGTTGRVGYWLMSGSTASSTREMQVALGYTVPAYGDFNGDGRLDLLWTSSVRDLWMWQGNAAGTFDSYSMGSYGAGWQIIAAADVDADGRSDLVWHNASSGRVGVWLMNGATPLQMREFGVALGYRVAAIGDFTGDRRADLLWTSNAGDMWIWPNAGSGDSGSWRVGTYGGGWDIIGAADVDGDTVTDLLWQNPNAGRYGHWLMSNGAVRQSAEFAIAVGYRLAGTGDYDGDGRADLLWTGDRGDLWRWPNATSGDAGSGLIANYGGGWQPLRNRLQP